jgi:hypothetical protein
VRMRKGSLLGVVLLLGTAVAVGVKCAVHYGWLAGHSHWLIHRRRPDL